VKEIPGHPGYYCDANGIIYSTKRGEARVLKSKIARTGYEQVPLSLGQRGRYRHALVHRLVLETFQGPAPEGWTCNHKNGNRSDNRLSNLEWMSRVENERHARTVLGKKLYGHYHPGSKLTPNDVVEIRALKASGSTYNELSKRFGVGISQLARIVKGEKWGHIGICPSR
jgi:hypothetical protein